MLHPIITRNTAPIPFAALVEDFFHDVLSESRPLARSFRPALDLREEDGAYLAVVELPGLGKEDVTLNLEDGVLTIKGEKQSERDEEQDGLRHTERSFGSFQRAVRLPKEVDAEGISAEMTNGVLTVRIPKAAKAKRKLITIN